MQPPGIGTSRAIGIGHAALGSGSAQLVLQVLDKELAQDALEVVDDVLLRVVVPPQELEAADQLAVKVYVTKSPRTYRTQSGGGEAEAPCWTDHARVERSAPTLRGLGAHPVRITRQAPARATRKVTSPEDLVSPLSGRGHVAPAPERETEVCSRSLAASGLRPLTLDAREPAAECRLAPACA